MLEDESSVEHLKRRLYARSGGPAIRPRRSLHEDAYQDVDAVWHHEDDVPENAQAPLAPEELLQELQQGRVPGKQSGPAILRDERFTRDAVREKQRRGTVSRIVRTIFFASLVFFVVSAGIAAYYFFLGKNLVSSENVDIEISGPVAIPAGEELALQLGIVNRNPVAMELVDLIIDYPDGARSANNVSVSLPRTRENLGAIEVGGTRKTTARTVLFGEEGAKQEIKVTVEYRIKDSNAIFFREVPYTVILSSAPVSISVDGLHEVSSGQPLDLTITVTSNSEKVLSNMLVRAEYPFGFEFAEAGPEPAQGNNVWELGDLEPGSKRTIKLSGFVQGQDDELRVFRFTTGGKDPKDPEKIVSSYQAVEHDLTIAKPFIDLALEINGETEKDDILTPGGLAQASLKWTNQLTYPLHNVEISARIEGPLLNVASVKPERGYWRSADRTILWTQETTNNLEKVEPGEQGQFNFQFNIQQLSPNTSARQETVRIIVSAKGRRIFEEEGKVPQEIVASEERTVKLASTVEQDPRLVYSTGPFVNTGPTPPRVDRETTYTVLWRVKNTVNDVVDASLSAKLPIYVQWLGMTEPSGAVTYNPVTRELLWRIGDIPAGTGYEQPAIGVAFQISFLPSISQLGSAPRLVENQILKGVDRFTGNVVETKPYALTSAVPSDPNVDTTDGIVCE